MLIPIQSAFPINPTGTSTGINQRDFAALMAMQGLAAAPDFNEGPQAAAELAYQYADAMIAASAQPPSTGPTPRG
jgi:hypothetical protein